MKTSPPRVFATVAAAAAQLVLPLCAVEPTPCLAAANDFYFSCDFLEETRGTGNRNATMTGTKAVWMSTTVTPALMANASFNGVLTDDLQDRAVGSFGVVSPLPDFPTGGFAKLTRITDVRGTTTYLAARRINSKNRGTITPTATTSSTTGDITAAHPSVTTTYQDNVGGRGHEDKGKESRWGRFRHAPLLLPDQFMARFLHALMYVAEVITADVVAGFVFGRWRPRYYQRVRKNRRTRRRKRRHRRFRMFADDLRLMIWQACMQLYDMLCPIYDDVSGPKKKTVSSLVSIEYPVTSSTFADVSMPEAIATVASARHSAVVPLSASSSASTPAWTKQPLRAMTRIQAKPPFAGQRSAISTFVPLLLAPPDMASGLSRHPGASPPGGKFEFALPPAVSLRQPLLLEAVPSSTKPSLSWRPCQPEIREEEMSLRSKWFWTTTFSAATAPTNTCSLRQSNTRMPISDTSDKERGWLAAPRVTLVPGSLCLPILPANPSAKDHNKSIVAAGPVSRIAEGVVHIVVKYNTDEGGAITSGEDLNGQADTFDSPPQAPFFVSERYTPESTCYVDAHGVAYTTITMSYGHRVNLPTKRETQDDTPTATQTGDVSDILFVAVNARMRCKWSRECIQTMSSEYYCSSVEAVFVSRFIPNEHDMVLLNDLVTRHL